MLKTEPPAAARLPVTRRTVLRSAGLAGAFAATPLAAQIGAQGFTHGVASGEPHADRVMLWTRHVAAQDVRLEWQVSDTLDFARIVSAGAVDASPERDWCCKAWASGLAADSWYYYRFLAPDGSASCIGRTRTLPDGPTERFRLGVFGCSNIGFGWFNAYAHGADANDFDLAVHTGDYFYEYAPDNYPSAEQKLAGRDVLPLSETVALADYRLRHASYRADPDLRRLHQLYPMVLGWDDHESANDSYAAGAENHQPESEGDWDVRKAAAVRAYREWLPVSDEPWAAYEIGDLATMFRLETRLTARSRPPSLGEIIRGKQTPDEMTAALESFRSGEYLDPARTMLGTAQESWLADGLRRSKAAGKSWQVLHQQVLMGSVSSPPSLAPTLGDDTPDYIRQRLTVTAMAGRAGLPFNMDAWDGYPAARARVLASAREADANLLVLAGDTHNAWAFEFDHEGERAGIEFGGQSVTSPGFEGYLANVPSQMLEGGLVQGNDQLKWANLSQRGYMVVELTPTRATNEYRFLDTIRARSTQLAGTQRISSAAGSHRLEIAG